jgi:hypothetical protein
VADLRRGSSRQMRMQHRKWHEGDFWMVITVFSKPAKISIGNAFSPDKNKMKNFWGIHRS